MMTVTNPPPTSGRPKAQSSGQQTPQQQPTVPVASTSPQQQQPATLTPVVSPASVASTQPKPKEQSNPSQSPANATV